MSWCIRFCLLIISILVYHDVQETHTDSTDTSEMVEVFRDDFNGDMLGLDWEVIDKLLPPLTYPPADRQNIRLLNGELRLRAVGKRNDSNTVYTSLIASTLWQFQFKYGEMTVRAKFPAYGSDVLIGLYACERTLTSNASCAVPPKPSLYVGYRASSASKNLRGSVDYVDRNEARRRSYGFYNDKDLSLDFHTHKLVWTSEKLEWYVDERWALNLTVPGLSTWPTMYVRLSIHPRLPENTTTANNNLPDEFRVDYVSVRQKRSPSTDAVKLSAVPLTLGIVLPIVALTAAVVLCWLAFRRYKAKSFGHYDGTFPQSTHFLSSTQRLHDISQLDYGLIVRDLTSHPRIRPLIIPSVGLQLAENILASTATNITRDGYAVGLCPPSQGPNARKVMVKSALLPNNPSHVRPLVRELETLANVGRHSNIIQALGAVLTDEVLILLEYSALGSLTNFLRKRCRVAFTNLVDSSGNIIPRQNCPTTQSTEEDVVLGSVSLENVAPEDRVPSTHTLLRFAYQISRGMEYLSNQRIIHRDLAARNILLFEGEVAKVAGFGMSRPGTEYVSDDMQEDLPVRWMPPEAMAERIFSLKSDVWSFGIMVWEIFSLGVEPYVGTQAIRGRTIGDFLAALRGGFRLDMPPTCPLVMYKLMTRCWQLSPKDRPEFVEIRESLQNIVGEDSRGIYLGLHFT
ncbi:fibroblast growth factor receptor-like isoform X2 [Paramacrobiotus metropolitanus]|uniref:fibroblast growth factor receptor-like isoform X2 n=1 Tax=Paramacrobiotus metropolitanus TaxID=2943436 RepID=UPI002445BB4C|nr:fibroblast growth factor receptor-like isoform X2 [Paramacrobiotus metropolitanus]